jgi:hypothetical protein
MNDIRYTLLSDGSSDQVLIPILTWLIRRHGVTRAIQPAWADLRSLRRPPETLSEKISLSVDLYPCDLLFVHRDAEGVAFSRRRAEILEALAEVSAPKPVVCVVPVRMQEAWLLIQESALRWASGNPNGQETLVLPKLKDLEELPDPKEVLYQLLRDASGLQGRRRKKFSVQTGARRVVEFIGDFSPLLYLEAFRVLDSDLREKILYHQWNETQE